MKTGCPSSGKIYGTAVGFRLADERRSGLCSRTYRRWSVSPIRSERIFKDRCTFLVPNTGHAGKERAMVLPHGAYLCQGSCCLLHWGGGGGWRRRACPRATLYGGLEQKALPTLARPIKLPPSRIRSAEHEGWEQATAPMRRRPWRKRGKE